MSLDDISTILGSAETAFGRHDYIVAIGLYKQALYLLGKETPSPQRERRKADVLLRIVDSLDMNGNWFDALIYVDTTVVIAQAWQDWGLEIDVNLRAARILLNRGSWKDVKKRLANVHEVINEPEYMDQKGDWLLYRGQAEMRLGHHGRSMELSKLALDLSEANADPVLDGMALALQGAIKHHMGELSSSLTSYHEAIDILQAEDRSDQVALCYDGMGSVYGTMGDHKMAVLQHDKCVQISREKGNIHNEAVGLIHSAWSRARDGSVSEAKKNLDAARKLLKGRGELFTLAELDRAQAAISFRDGDHVTMTDRYQSAIKKMVEMGTLYHKGSISLEYGQSMKGTGKKDEAKRAFEVSLEAFDLIGASYYTELVKKEL